MQIIASKCMACGICSDVCPNKAIVFGGTKGRTAAAIKHSKCTNCGACKDACPAECIKENV